MVRGFVFKRMITVLVAKKYYREVYVVKKQTHHEKLYLICRNAYAPHEDELYKRAYFRLVLHSIIANRMNGFLARFNCGVVELRLGFPDLEKVAFQIEMV